MANKSVAIRAGESIFIDFINQGAVLAGTVEGAFSIKNNLGVEVASGPMDKSVDSLKFELRIASSETVGLSVGTYLLLVSAFDITTGYLDFILEADVEVYA